MAKADYSKVESALDAQLLNMRAQQLATLADFYQKPSKGARYLQQRRIRLQRWALLKSLYYDIIRMYKQDRDAYYQFKVKRKEVKAWLERFDELNESDWEQIDAISERMESYKQEHQVSIDSEKEASTIDEKRQKQRTQRFNVRSHWLPLH